MNPASFSYFNGSALSWMRTLFSASWQGALLIIAVWLLCRLAPRLPASWRGGLWWLACLKLLVGLATSFTLPLPLLPPAPAALPTPLVAQVAEARPNRSALMPPADATFDSTEVRYAAWNSGATTAHSSAHKRQSASGKPMLVSALTIASVRAQSAKLASLLLCLWLGGVLWRGLIFTRQAGMLRHILNEAEPLNDAERVAEVAALAAALGLRRVPSVLISKHIASPIMAGLLRPVALLPGAVELTPDERRLALAHELTHIRRGDLWFGLVPILAQTLFFFHPLVWVACHEFAMAREEACDGEAVRVTGTPVDAYGRLLVKLGATGQGSSFALGMRSHYRMLKRRLETLQTFSATSRPRVLAGGTLLAVVAAVGVLPWRVVAASPAAPARIARIAQAVPAPPVVICEQKCVEDANKTVDEADKATDDSGKVMEDNSAAVDESNDTTDNSNNALEAMDKSGNENADDEANIPTPHPTKKPLPKPLPVAIPEVAMLPPSPIGSLRVQEAARSLPAQQTLPATPGDLVIIRVKQPEVVMEGPSAPRLIPTRRFAAPVRSFSAEGAREEANANMSSEYRADSVRTQSETTVVNRSNYVYTMNTRDATALDRSEVTLSTDAIQPDENEDAWTITSCQQTNRVMLHLTVGDDCRARHLLMNLSLENFSGLTWEALQSDCASARFQLHREQGTLTFEGQLRKGRGKGTFTFEPDSDFVEKLSDLGYDSFSDYEFLALMLHEVTQEYIAALKELGYDDLPVEKLVALRRADIPASYIAEFKDLGYAHLSAGRLVEMRRHGLSPEFVRALRAFGYDRIPVAKLVKMQQLAVNADYIQQLRQEGFSHLTVDELLDMRTHGLPLPKQD